MGASDLGGGGGSSSSGWIVTFILKGVLNKYRGVYSSPRNETYYKYISGWEQGRSGWKQAGSAGHRKWQSC